MKRQNKTKALRLTFILAVASILSTGCDIWESTWDSSMYDKYVGDNGEITICPGICLKDGAIIDDVVDISGCDEQNGSWYERKAQELSNGTYIVKRDNGYICGEYSYVTDGLSQIGTTEEDEGYCSKENIEEYETLIKHNSICPKETPNCVIIKKYDRVNHTSQNDGSMCSACSDGQSLCQVNSIKSACINLDTDNNHCGDCHTQCDRGFQCRMGVCEENWCEGSDEEKQKRKDNGYVCLPAADNKDQYEWKCPDSPYAWVEVQKDGEKRCFDPANPNSCGVKPGDKELVKCSESIENSICELGKDNEYSCVCNGEWVEIVDSSDQKKKCVSPEDPQYCGISSKNPEQYENCAAAFAQCVDGQCVCESPKKWVWVNKEQKYRCADSTSDQHYCAVCINGDDNDQGCDDNQACKDTHYCVEGKCKELNCSDSELVCTNLGFCVDDNIKDMAHITDCTTCAPGYCAKDNDIAANKGCHVEQAAYHLNSTCKGCEQGWADSDNNLWNGCNINTLTDKNNCGRVGQQCDENATCLNGSCICNSGFTTCKNNQDVCYDMKAYHIDNQCRCVGWWTKNDDNSIDCNIDMSTDSKNCGIKGNECGNGSQCQDGNCVCSAEGYTSCSQVKGSASAPVARSLDSKVCLKYSAVHMDANCNCLSGWVDANSNVDDGCEQPTSNNPSYCGPSKKKCPVPDNGKAVCIDGTCGIVCNANYTQCGDQCINLSSDVNNCGACNHICSAPKNGSVTAGSATCNIGQCGFLCDSDHLLCNNQCVSKNSDDHCGSCDKQCPSSEHKKCSAGQCVCISSYTAVPTNPLTCVDLKTDNDNCGTVGNQCVYGTRCSAGKCTCDSSTNALCSSIKTPSKASAPVARSIDPNYCLDRGKMHVTSSCTCEDGWIDEDNYVGNGCEKSAPVYDTQNDPQHCGNSTTPCPSTDNGTAVCISGVCGVQCDENYTRCENSCVDTKSDDRNCGSCGQTCGLNRRCHNSECCWSSGVETGESITKCCESDQVICAKGEQAGKKQYKCDNDCSNGWEAI